ncbi:MAG: MinD/ParA family protein [Halanaerobiales bacterium]|nr:MinD/ParA family protein [Halanaerobiales bacterium]
MKDQAERLRQLAKESMGYNESSSNVSKSARVIAVTSGKGGVGKTNFAVNLALALQAEGKKTVIFDGDLGMANIDVVLGVVPTFNLVHVTRGHKTLQEIMVEGPNGVQFLPGSSGAEELADLTDGGIQQLINQWTDLEGDFDYILIDTGAGIHSSVMNFLQSADEIIVILTAEPPSITDAYGLIKVLAKKDVQAPIHLVVNQAANLDEGRQIFRRVNKVALEFLKMKLNLIGVIPYDEKVSISVKRQKPFILGFPNSHASRGVQDIARNLLELSPEKPAGGMKQFLSRMIGFFRRDQEEGR